MHKAKPIAPLRRFDGRGFARSDKAGIGAIVVLDLARRRSVRPAEIERMVIACTDSDAKRLGELYRAVPAIAVAPAGFEDTCSTTI